MTPTCEYGAANSTQRQVPVGSDERAGEDYEALIGGKVRFTGHIGAAASHRRPAALELAGAFAAGAVLVVVAACSGGDDEADEPPSTSATSSTESVANTQPPASGDTEDEAFAAVRQVVAEATGLVDRLFQDPELVDNPANVDIDRLRQLYTPRSATPDGVEAQLRELVDGGLRMQPAGTVFRDLGVYQLAAVDENTIQFRVCATEDQETVDTEGTVVDVLAQVTQGDGEAHRVDGIWRLDHIEPRDDLTLPFEAGSADPGFCDQAYGEDSRP
jgi:hypothetical protein